MCFLEVLTCTDLDLPEPESSTKMGEDLATESFQSFHMLKTEANEDLEQAIEYFRRSEMTKSANLFLKCWRTLTSKSQRYSEIWSEIRTGNSTHNINEVALEEMRLDELRLCIISDLALACLRNDKPYEDSEGNPALNVHICNDAWTGNKTVEKLKYNGTDKEIGTDVGTILKLQDPFGEMLQSVSSFIDAACVVAWFGITRCYPRQAWAMELSEHTQLPKRSLIWIYNLTNWHNFFDDHNLKKIGLKTTVQGEYPEFITEQKEWNDRFYK